MTIRSLEIFMAVASLGKMSDAARQLHIAQPTVSQAIAEIEKEYDLILFNRLSKKLFITDAGRLLLNYAQSILTSINDMDKTLKILSQNRTVMMGATMTVGSCLMLELVTAFEKSHPNVQVNVTIDNTAVIETLLLESSIDIAFVEGTIKSSELISVPVIDDELVLVCSRKHELSSYSSIDITMLQDRQFVLREEGSGTREIFLDLLNEHNVSVNVKWTCQSSDTNLAAVSATNSLTVISKRLVSNYISKGELAAVPIENISMRRSFNLVYHKSKHFTDWLKQLAEFIYSQSKANAGT